MELHFIILREKEVGCFWMAVSGWKNKVMDTESDERLWKGTVRKKSFVHGQY